VEKSAWLEKRFSSLRGSPAMLAARCRRLRRRQGTPTCGFQPSRSSRRASWKLGSLFSPRSSYTSIAASMRVAKQDTSALVPDEAERGPVRVERSLRASTEHPSAGAAWRLARELWQAVAGAPTQCSSRRSPAATTSTHTTQPVSGTCLVARKSPRAKSAARSCSCR
jgi:hypothetical protein